MKRQDRIDRILAKCEKAGCSEEKQKEHMRLYVDNGWDVHPPQAFVDWWADHPEKEVCGPIGAWNTKRYHDDFRCVPDSVPGFQSNPKILAEHRARLEQIKGKLRSGSYGLGPPPPLPPPAIK